MDGPTTLADLLGELRQRAAAHTQAQVLTWLGQLCELHGLRMCHDRLAPVPASAAEASGRDRPTARVKKSAAATPAEKDAPADAATTENASAESTKSAPGAATEDTAATADLTESAPAAPAGKDAPAATAPADSAPVVPAVAVENTRLPPDAAEPAEWDGSESAAPDEVTFRAPAEAPSGTLGGASGGASAYFENLEGCVGRVILSCNRRNVDTEVQLRPECNGVVIDARTWRPLAVPPRAFNPRPCHKRVNLHLAAGLYDLIRVNDGTVVTLYRWKHPRAGPVWCLATGNGYDVSPFRWMGPRSYAEIVHDLLHGYPAPDGRGSAGDALGVRVVRDRLCAGDIRLEFDRPPPASYSYTLGFRCHDFHPLLHDPPGIWNIQAVRLKDGARFYPPAALPPLQPPPPSRTGGLWPLPPQLYLNPQALAQGRPAGSRRSGVVSVSDLLRMQEQALQEAQAAVARGAVGFEHFNYGVILRSRRPDCTLESSDLILRSPLLEAVQRIAYRRVPPRDRPGVGPANRLWYNFTRAYLTASRREQLLSLFPGLHQFVARCDEFGKAVVDRAVAIQRARLLGDKQQCRRLENPEEQEDVAERKRTLLAQGLRSHILDHDDKGAFNALNGDAHSIAWDYFLDPGNALIYLKALGRGTPGAV